VRGTIGEIKWMTIIEPDCKLEKAWGAYRLGKFLKSIQPIHVFFK